MTRRQFLNDLYRRLDALPRKEAEEHLTYYAEMLADRMEEGMTEAEAVASMENVDTIARRILQDAGVSERSVFDDPEAAAEPAAATEKPVKKRRRWILALVAAALLLALPVLAVGGLIASGVVEALSDGIRVTTDDSVVSIGADGIHILGEDGATVEIGPGGITVGEQVPPGPADALSWEVDPAGIREIQVDWSAGTVRVEHWEGDVIRLTERFDGAADSDKKDRFVYTVEGEELKVVFDSRKSFAGEKDKELVISLPQAYIPHELEIETASADVTVAAPVGEIKAATASGDLRVSCSAQLRELEAATASGDVHLLLEQDMPFSLEFGTAVGKLNHNLSDLEMTREGCRRGRGGAELEVATASGDLYLWKAE